MPANDERPEEKLEQMKMVGWYDPSQLANTAAQVLISQIFGKHADRREMQAIAPGSALIQDYTGPAVSSVDLDKPGAALAGPADRQEIWIDYVADVGDGWNPTYAVAYCLAHPLSLKDPAGTVHELPRGDVLIFGGDEVYPVGSAKAYRDRLEVPYEKAFGWEPTPGAPVPAGNPDVYALPGNHDWYNSLVSFSRLFCSRELFAGCRTRQRRSYFALRLPHDWWLVGIDVQLGSDIDGPQCDFFLRVAEHMSPDAQIILCTPEPHWIYAKYLRKYDPTYNEDYLRYLEEEVLKRPVRVFLAGDIHHYRRHEAVRGTEKEPRTVQKITAGGGGAFLHPTHGRDVSTLRPDFMHRMSYPDRKTSWWLCFWNLIFPLLNWRFVLLMGACYLALAWVLMSTVMLYRESVVRGYLSAPNFINLFAHDWRRPEDQSRTVVVWLPWALVCAIFILFTDLRAYRARILLGLAHGTTHYLVVLGLLWLALMLFYHDIDRGLLSRDLLSLSQEEEKVFSRQLTDFQTPKSRFPLVMLSLFVCGAGGILGSFLFGLYLLISLNFFRIHWNEAFSALGIQDWKNFLRIRIDPDGALTIYPVGIRHVPRKWRPCNVRPGLFLEPDPPAALAPELIEPPIRVSK